MIKEELIASFFLICFVLSGATLQPRVLLNQGFHLTIVSSSLSYVAT